MEQNSLPSKCQGFEVGEIITRRRTMKTLNEVRRKEKSGRAESQKGTS